MSSNDPQAHPARVARQTMVERLDAIAMQFEEAAAEAVDEGEMALAADLWITTSRILAAAEELWRPVNDPSLDG